MQSPPNAPVKPGCGQRQLVDRYFAGRLSPAGQRQLRPHLDDCPHCRSHFERHLALAGLDPEALDFDERVGRAVGARAAGVFRSLSRPRMAFIGALAASALVLVARTGWEAAPSAEFQTRGGGDTDRAALVFALGTPATDVLAFRTDAGAAGLQTGRLPGSAELAFAYRNGGGWPWLMVFARDELGQVYWYQPPWTDGRQDPPAVALSSSQGLHELPQAMSHTFSGRRLALCVLLSQQPLTVSAIDEQLRTAQTRPPADLLGGPGREVACRDLEVTP